MAAVTLEATAIPVPEIHHEGLHHCEELHNDISQQTKEKEETYIIRDWAMEKLNQIKTASTLMVNTHIHPQSIKVNNNVISAQITTYLNKTATMEFTSSRTVSSRSTALTPQIPPSSPSNLSRNLLTSLHTP